MYSGTELTRASGRILGAHQKIDRVARRQLATLLSDNSRFPKTSQIIAFEGRNGPDGIKLKSPAKDEPWHYINPFDDSDTQLLEQITHHYKSLVKHLKDSNQEGAAFEAAWLAHAIVDGLTPAHHYPYEEKLVELRGGRTKETRTTYKEKLIMHGDTRREKVHNNWKMWGAKGLFMSHSLFEIGVATLIKPLNFKETMPTEADLELVRQLGVVKLFHQTAKEVAVLEIYDNYLRKGWTPRLAWQIRHRLGPAMVKTVALAWYASAKEAKLAE